MDAIVPPGNTSLVTNDSDRYAMPCYSDKSAVILDRISTAAENIMGNDNSNAHHAASTAERIGLAGIDHTNQNGVESRTTTNVNGAESRLLTNQNGLEGRSVTERNGLETRGNVERSGLETRDLVREEAHESRDAIRKEGHETRDEVERFGFRSQDAIERFGLKNLEATKDSLKDILMSSKEDLKNVLISQKDDLKDVLISQKNDFREVLLKNCQVEKDMLLQFKDAQLIAMQNKADLAAQIAECCCEQKELTRAKADETQSLIRSLDEQGVRDKLRKAETDLEILRLRASLTPPLVAAVSV